MKGDSLKTLKNSREEVSQSQKEGGESLIVAKNWIGVPICYCMVLYFMLEALDAFKMKY